MSETPLEYLPKLTQDLPGRRIRLSNYGLILRREGVVRQGGNRVWYINKDWTSVGNWLTKEIDTLIDLACNGLSYDIAQDGSIGQVPPERSPIARLSAFTDWIVPGTKDFSWEREWRVAREVILEMSTLAAVIVPEEDHAGCEADLKTACEYGDFPFSDPVFVAPTWPSEYVEDILEP